MESGRRYLFCRLKYLVDSIERLYAEQPEIATLLAEHSNSDESSENTIAYMTRRAAYCPQQIDALYRELAQVASALRDLNRDTVKLTGNLSTGQQHFSKPNPLFAKQTGDVTPTQARPPLNTAKSVDQLRTPTGVHPAFRKVEGQSESPWPYKFSLDAYRSAFPFPAFNS